MNLEELNKVSRLDDFLPVIKPKDLTIGELYNITEIKVVKTKYGSSVILELNEEFSLFLPRRITKFILKSDETLKNFTDRVKAKAMGIRSLGGKKEKN